MTRQETFELFGLVWLMLDFDCISVGFMVNIPECILFKTCSLILWYRPLDKILSRVGALVSFGNYTVHYSFLFYFFKSHSLCCFILLNHRPFPRLLCARSTPLHNSRCGAFCLGCASAVLKEPSQDIYSAIVSFELNIKIPRRNGLDFQAAI